MHLLALLSKSNKERLGCACLTLMRTAFATNRKSPDTQKSPPAITTLQPRKRAIAFIPIRDTTTMVIALMMRTQMEFATVLKWMDAHNLQPTIMILRPLKTTAAESAQPQGARIPMPVISMKWPTLTMGACYYTCIGCIDDNALNYNSEARISSGLCFFGNEEEALKPGSCVGDLNSDGIRGTTDLLMFLSYLGLQCEK